MGIQIRNRLLVLGHCYFIEWLIFLFTTNILDIVDCPFVYQSAIWEWASVISAHEITLIEITKRLHVQFADLCLLNILQIMEGIFRVEVQELPNHTNEQVRRKRADEELLRRNLKVNFFLSIDTIDNN